MSLDLKKLPLAQRPAICYTTVMKTQVVAQALFLAGLLTERSDIRLGRRPRSTA